MPYDLKGLKVLVTRPGPQGELLCNRIDEVKGSSVYFPAIEIFPPDKLDLLHQQIKTLNQYDWIIFVSPQAVLQTAKVIHDNWPVLPEIKIAAIGAGTADTLKNFKFPVAVYPKKEWNSEGLLELTEFKEVKGKKIAIISGEGGREFLENTLIKRGAAVTKMVAYKRCPPKDPAVFLQLLKSHSIDIIVLTSNQGLENLEKCVIPDKQEELLHSIRILVVSERIAKYAEELGFKKIILAKNASNESILDALNHQ